MTDSFYRAFEDRHRGSRELIKSRLRAYEPFIKPIGTLYPSAAAIDLGCGRGEWLELLGEHGFDALGVDLDEGMLAACRELGLNARKAEALDSLRALPADSMALVSAFHVVEHMPFADVRSLMSEALRVLKPGGLLILETPNPENLVVGACSFYQDPSHVRPIPPELLNFVAEHAGFQRNKLVRLQEAPELLTSANPGLVNVLNGVSPDYSVVAQKTAATEVLAGFDAAFHVDYGISLITLAQRYDSQMESRLDNIRRLVMRADAQAAQSRQQTAVQMSYVDERLAQIEAHAAKLEARAAQTEVWATQADARAAQLGTLLHEVLHSRSWRITAPLRFVAGTIYRFRNAVREGRLISGSKRRIKLVLRRLGQEVQQRPRFKQATFWMLKHMPAVERRLRSVMHGPASVDVQMLSQKPSHLSPRAMHIYTELKKAIEARKH